MSNEELAKVTKRLNTESDFISAVNRRNNFTKKEVKEGKNFFNKVKDDVVVPAATNAARTQAERWLNKKLGDMLGLNSTKKDTLKEQVNKLELEKKKLQYTEDLERLRAKRSNK